MTQQKTNTNIISTEISSRQGWTDKERKNQREKQRVNYFLDKKIEKMQTKTKLPRFDRNKWSGNARMEEAWGAWEDEFTDW